MVTFGYFNKKTLVLFVPYIKINFIQDIFPRGSYLTVMVKKMIIKCSPEQE